MCPGRATVTNCSEQTFKLAYNVLFNCHCSCLGASRVLPLPIFQVARGEEVLQGSEDADAAPSTGGQREEQPLGSFLQSWAFVGNIWNLGTPEFIYEFMKHKNSYMKKSYEFIGYMISYMNSYI